MSALTHDHDYFSKETQGLEEKLKEILQVINCSLDAVVEYSNFISIGYRLVIIRWRTLKIRDEISGLDIDNEEQRITVREIASMLGELVHKYDQLHEITSTKAKNGGLIVRPAWNWISRILEDLACISEDLAETLALSANKEFTELVATELSEKEL